MRTVLVACVLSGACGGGDGGEPIGGTIVVGVGDETIAPTVGAAIPDEVTAGNISIVVGTRDISCATTNDSPIKAGTYVSFVVAPAVGAQMPFVAVIRVESGGAHIDGAGGDVTIDGVDGGRITGNLTFATTDNDDGTPITASGTFDVIDCR